MVRGLRGGACGAALVVIAATAGCGWILGLDEFTDQPPPGDGGGGAAQCVTPDDCPGGDHGSATCEAGACGFQCEGGFADCDEAVGCETATSADKQNCGGCGVTCSAYCVAGSCNDPVYIAAGFVHACAILKDGSVWCWGAEPAPNGNGNVDNHVRPTRLPVNLPVTQVALGGAIFPWLSHRCLLLEDHTVQCYGRNDYGQLGIGTTTFTETLVDVGLSDIRQIAVGGLHTCAVNINGVLFCWGANSSGQVGDGTTADVLWPVEVATSVADVSAGEHHTCALKTDGYFECWGGNANGQLGNGSQVSASLPTPVTGISQGLQLACGARHTCARNSFGVYCWGANQYGQLGLGTNLDEYTPQPLSVSGPEAVAVGAYHSGLIAGGEAYMWGANSLGALGDGTAVDAHAPVQIGLGGVKTIELGTGFSCALMSNSSILCWGDNSFGELGDGTTASRSTPSEVVWW